MKKLISLSATVLFIGMAFGQQDTIPAPGKKNFQDSSKMNPIPNLNKDTTSLNPNTKWPDTSMNRNRPDTTPKAMDQSNTNNSNATANTTTTSTSSQTDSTSTAKKTTADRVVMIDDKVMVVKNGDSTLLADSVTLQSGAVVTKDGSVNYTSGKSTKLKNGQYVSLNAAPDNDSQADSSTSTSASSSPATKPQTADEDKVIMVGEKVYVVKSGDSTVLTDSIKLKSGALVKSDATVKFKDGTSTTLKNGQYIALNPPVTPATESKSKEDTTAAATASASTAAAKPVEDRVVMKDDQIIVVKNGDSTVLEDSIKLSSGAVVKKDGSVKFKNGSTTKLKNGQFIALNPAAPAEGKKTKKTTSATKKKANG